MILTSNPSFLAGPGVSNIKFDGSINGATLASYGGGTTLQPWLAGILAIGWPEFGITSASAYTSVAKVTDGGISVLRAEIIGNNPSDAGRFQGSTYQPTGVDQGVYHHSQRMKLGSGLASLTNYASGISAASGSSWFSVFETWMGSSVSRMTLSLNKASGAGNPIRWELTCEWEEGSSTPYVAIWTVPVNTTPIPFGKWFTMDVYIKSGTGSAGRIKITITVDGEAPIVLFDVFNTTIAPGYPTTYRRKTDHMKFYIGPTLRAYMLTQGYMMEVFFGDYRIFSD